MCVTMIDPVTSWFEMVELLVSQLPEFDIPMSTKRLKGTDTQKQHEEPYFDETSATVGTLINRTWFSLNPHSQYIVYDNGSECKLHFKTLCNSYGLKQKLTSVKNLQANTVLEHVHQNIIGCTALLKLTWPTQSEKVTLHIFSLMLHGPFTIPTTQYSKPHQAQLFLGGSCCLMLPS